jgi:hypothetical protein
MNWQRVTNSVVFIVLITLGYLLGRVLGDYFGSTAVKLAVVGVVVAGWIALQWLRR